MSFCGLKDETVSDDEDCSSFSVPIESVVAVDEDGVVSSVMSCFVEALVMIDDDFIGTVVGRDLYVAVVDDKTRVAGLD